MSFDNRTQDRNSENANWREDKAHSFVNPYNFVGLGGNVKRSTAEYGNYTGVIDCKLTLSTPLAVPDHETLWKTKETDRLGKEQIHEHYKFFKVNGVPTLTGSEIRGVIRSAYEAASNSCLSVNNNDIFSARHTTPRLEGVLQFSNNKWHLFEARMKKLKHESGKIDKIHTIREWTDCNKPFITNQFEFEKSINEVECEDLERAINDYNEVFNIYMENDKKRFEKYKVIPKADGNIYPVFYEIVKDNDKKYVYLSPAQMSRSVFVNRLNDILGSHSHVRCSQSSEICEACNMFGLIGDTTTKATKVRFTDAKPCGDYKYINDVTLRELAGPKITSLEFYTRRPAKDAVTWTFDYKTTGYKTTGNKTTGYRKEYSANRSKTVAVRSILADNEKIVPNGRKFYYHSNSDYSTSEKTQRNISTDLLDKGTVMEFKLYFDELTEYELKRLVWLLALGENTTDSKHQFKFGHGKPIGLGSAKVTVDKVTLRSFDKETMQYAEKTDDTASYFIDCPFDFNEKYFKELMKICDTDAVKGMNVSYPLAADDCKNSNNSSASHQWFIANRTLGNAGTSTNWSIKYTLPEILAPSQALPRMVKVDFTQKVPSPRNDRPSTGQSSSRGYSNSNYQRSEPVSDKVKVICSVCHGENEIARASYDMLASRGIKYKCIKCKK